MELVSEVFDTNPRDGNRTETVWLDRTTLQKTIEDELYTKGRHICIDGCSGSGKSSLAITTLLKCRVSYTTVQVTRTMTWPDFCKQLIQKPQKNERDISIDGAAGWAGAFPTGKLEFHLGEKTDKRLDHEHWERLVATATEHDIAKAIAKQNCVVLIDDFERARQELATSVSEVCKILTQTYNSQFGKLIILGADDVYKKLYDAYSTLDNRLCEISIPTLPSPGESWKYLRLGFRKLNKFHPGNSLYAGPDDGRKAVEAIYHAADGLFKSLTELAIEICREVGASSRGIKLHHIQRVCKLTEERNFAKYRSRFTEIHRLADKYPVTVAILLHMNEKGIGQIHKREEIEIALSNCSKTLVDEAIYALVKADLLVMTGSSNEKLFIKNPSWAHTLRVYLSNPQKKNRLEQYLEKPLQFKLDMGIDWDSLDIEGKHEQLD